MNMNKMTSFSPAWREQPVQRRNMQDGSTLVEGPMDRLNVQPGKEGRKANEKSWNIGAEVVFSLAMVGTQNISCDEIFGEKQSES